MSKQKVRRPLSKKNPYYISKERNLELIYFCLQYPEWKRYLKEYGMTHEPLDEWADPTGDEAIEHILAKEKIDLVERTAKLAGPDIYEYLLMAVTVGLSYTTLSAMYDIPCGHDYYYERYHRFWWLLSQEKHRLL